MSYEAFIAACSKECRCCGFCSVHPCDGVLAGGLCDRSRCTCNDIEEEPLDYDENEEDAP